MLRRIHVYEKSHQEEPHSLGVFKAKDRDLQTDRTNNLCESWNRGFTAVVGHQHPSLWTAVEALQEDAAAATTVLLQNARGQPPAKRVKRATLQLQRQLQTLCRERRDGRRSVADTLRAVSHTVRFE